MRGVSQSPPQAISLDTSAIWVSSMRDSVARPSTGSSRAASTSRIRPRLRAKRFDGIMESADSTGRGPCPASGAPLWMKKSSCAGARLTGFRDAGMMAHSMNPTRQVLGAILLVTLVRAAVSVQLELTSVESYLWVCAQRPAPGYYDYPGMIAWMGWLSTSLFGHTPLGVRAATILSAGGMVW